LWPSTARPERAVGDGDNLAGVYPEVGQVFPNRVRALLAQGKVVFLRAAFVAVAFHAQGVGRVAFQKADTSSNFLSSDFLIVALSRSK